MMHSSNIWWNDAANNRPVRSESVSSPRDQTSHITAWECWVFSSSSSSVWTQTAIVSVIFSLQCTPGLPLCFETALRLHRTGNTLRVPSGLIVRGENEEMCSRGDLLHLSVSVDFGGSCFFSTRSSWSVYSAGAQSVIFIKGPIQRKHKVLYCIHTQSLQWQLGDLQHGEDVMIFIFQERDSCVDLDLQPDCTAARLQNFMQRFWWNWIRL